MPRFDRRHNSRKNAKRKGAQKCVRCDGKGTVPSAYTRGLDTTCPSCHGRGTR